MADVPQRAGWYPDPDGIAGERWWNGAGWSDSRRGSAAAQPADYLAPPVIYSAENPAPQSPDALAAPARAITVVNAKVNPMALYGLIAGVIGVFFNFIPVASIIAIVFSARGLARANQLRAAGDPKNLRTLAIVGLVLGIGGTAWSLLQAAIVIVGIIGSFSVSVS